MALPQITSNRRTRREETLTSLLERRRSVRRLRGGPFDTDALVRIAIAAHLCPSAYNQPPWHVVVLRERAGEFWETVERAFRIRLEGDRLERYLHRLDGFRDGVAVALVYEDRAVLAALEAAWSISPGQASAFSEQALGMVQLSLWLAVVEEGLATSLQHWEALIEEDLAAFLDLPAGRYRLAAAMPIGYADEEPRAVERAAPHEVVSLDRFARGDPRVAALLRSGFDRHGHADAQP